MPAPHDLVRSHFATSLETMQRASSDVALLNSVSAIAEHLVRSFKSGRKVLLAGNGGSAADAQHIATEFLARFRLDRNPLPALALTTDTSALTAIGNDFGFDQVFERQLRGLGARGDVFIGISTSGRSRNVIAALKAAREIGVTTIGFTGAGKSDMLALCDLVLAAPSEDTAQVQQIHITAAHAICDVVERELFPPKA